MTSPSEHEGMQPAPAAASGHVQTVADHDAEHGHDHGEADAGPHFTDQQWKEFQDDDVHAGGAIVALMASIFVIGLMLYTTIALIVGA